MARRGRSKQKDHSKRRKSKSKSKPRAKAKSKSRSKSKSKYRKDNYTADQSAKAAALEKCMAGRPEYEDDDVKESRCKVIMAHGGGGPQFDPVGGRSGR